jgi:excisionase family DNA binding protein
MDTRERLLLTVPEAAARLSLGRSKVYELLTRGELQAVRIGRAVRIPVAELEHFVARLAASGVSAS